MSDMRPTVVDEFMRMGVGQDLTELTEQSLIIMYRRKLFEMSANRYTWHGLPDSCDARFVETTIYHAGLCVFYFDDMYNKFLALRGAPAGELDYMDNPTKFLVTGNRLINKTLDRADAVPIWGNYSRQPDVDIVNNFARRLANLDRTIEINSDNARQSKVLVMDQDSRLSVENINAQMARGVPAIRATSNPNQFMTTIDMGVDAMMFDKLGLARSRAWTDCMTLLGIGTTNTEKKERQNVDEVNANNEQTDVIKQTNLKARQIAAKQINERFGLRVSVEFNVSGDSDTSTYESYGAEVQAEFARFIGGV